VITTLGSVLLVVCAAEATAFVVLYAITARWWTSEFGRHVMALMFVLMLVLDLSVVRVYAGVSLEVPWFAALRLIVFALVPIVLGQRLWLLWKVQVRDRRRSGVDRGDSL
jgi:hypothetical protein